ncbi:MAG: capsid cement protein [Cyanobacteria bacterium P01_F01_bin.56]
MRTDGLAKAFTAGGAIPAHTIIKGHTTAGEVVVGAAATDKVFGVSTEVDAATGDRVDVYLPGSIAPVIYGGAIEVGDLLTSDANGHAVATTTANDRVIGVAMTAGADNDIGHVCIQVSNL